MAKPYEYSCTNCGSTNLFKDGIKPTAQGRVQRFMCRDCGKRLISNIWVEKYPKLIKEEK
jgi:predicted SprT family Zn-dependent metalloprotease